jgi:arylsulfatase A-like enzyme
MVLHNDRKRLVGTDLYDGEIRYTDDNIEHLVGLLKKHGVYDNTMIVITSDHGEEFFEHGTLGHGFSLYQEVVRVPLIFHGAGVAKGRVVKSPVAIVDLDATILELAGVPLGETRKFGDGTSFAPAFQNPNWKREGDFMLENEFGEDDEDLRSFVLSAVRDGSWKFILNEQNAYRPPDNEKYGRLELYDLATDPGEIKNLIHEAKNNEKLDERGKEMFERLSAHSQFLEETGFRKIPPAALSAETEAALDAIGYLKGRKKAKKEAKKE